jgi:hypothetical protein
MFYRGDIIRCVMPNGVLSLNRLYAVMGGGYEPTIINDLGYEANYRGERFELVEPVSQCKRE